MGVIIYLLYASHIAKSKAEIAINATPPLPYGILSKKSFSKIFFISDFSFTSSLIKNLDR